MERYLSVKDVMHVLPLVDGVLGSAIPTALLIPFMGMNSVYWANVINGIANRDIFPPLFHRQNPAVAWFFCLSRRYLSIFVLSKDYPKLTLIRHILNNIK